MDEILKKEINEMINKIVDEKLSKESKSIDNEEQKENEIFKFKKLRISTVMMFIISVSIAILSSYKITIIGAGFIVNHGYINKLKTDQLDIVNALVNNPSNFWNLVLRNTGGIIDIEFQIIANISIILFLLLLLSRWIYLKYKRDNKVKIRNMS